MLNYALRVNLTIAIVAMVEEPKGSKLTTIAPPTIEHNDTFSVNDHSMDELRSAAHTLSIETTPQPFQNDNVSSSRFSLQKIKKTKNS